MKGVYTTLQCLKDLNLGWGPGCWFQNGTAGDASNMALPGGGSCPVSCTHLSVPLGHSWLKFWFNLLCSKIEVNILVSCWIQCDLDCTKLKFVEEMVKAISLHQNKVPTDWWMLSQHLQNPSMVPCWPPRFDCCSLHTHWLNVHP